VSSCANSWNHSIIERSFSNVKDTKIFALGGVLATSEVLWQEVVWLFKRHFGHSGGTLVVKEVVWKFDRLYIVNSF